VNQASVRSSNRPARILLSHAIYLHMAKIGSSGTKTKFGSSCPSRLRLSKRRHRIRHREWQSGPPEAAVELVGAVLFTGLGFNGDLAPFMRAGDPSHRLGAATAPTRPDNGIDFLAEVDAAIRRCAEQAGYLINATRHPVKGCTARQALSLLVGGRLRRPHSKFAKHWQLVIRLRALGHRDMPVRIYGSTRSPRANQRRDSSRELSRTILPRHRKRLSVGVDDENCMGKGNRCQAILQAQSCWLEVGSGVGAAARYLRELARPAQVVE